MFSKRIISIVFLLLSFVPVAWSADTVWVEDTAPSGATLAGTGETWTWVSANPTPFSGSVAHQSALIAGNHQHYFQATPLANRLSVNAGDTLFAYVYLDPANPPSEVMLQWNDFSWEHRAYWGANSISYGVNGTNGRRYMGALPPLGQWVRLEVPASLVGLEGRSLSGMAFTLYNGRATWDRAGKASSGVSNVAPTVTITAPSNGASYIAPANITIDASASDSDGTISMVEFYNGATLISTDTSAPYSASLTNVATGSYTYTAKAYDNLGAITTSAAINVNVTASNVAPTVTITAPSNGAIYTAPANIVIDATATDSDGTISMVEFYNGAALLNTDTSAPYSFNWSSVPAGTYTLTAKAYDNADASTVSTPITVTVNPGAGVDVIWVEDAPPSGATLAGTGETWTWVSANPTPFSGSVAHQSALIAGNHQHYFQATPLANRLSVNAGDTLFAYVYLDPANPPSEVMLQWNDFSWEHRAYWGANSISYGVNGTNGRRYMGALPPLGQWVRLEVPASLVGLEGRSLSGMAFTLYNGRATWDRAGKASSGVSNVAPVISSVTATPQTLLDNATSQLQVVASDSDGPSALSYSWSIVSGGGSLSSTAIANPLYTPANVATPTSVIINVAVSDGAATANQSITLTVNDAGLPLAVGTSTLPNGTVGANYNQTLVASGGTLPYTWSIVNGTLLPGLTLAPTTGIISGTPSLAGSSNFTVRVTDANGITANQPLTLTIANAASVAGIYFIYTDHLNTPRLITDTSNKAVWRWDSDAFGTDMANENPSGAGTFTYNLRFPGQYFDKSTNLHYNYFRDYDPTTGRYGQSDPIGLAGGINTYAYVGGNPVSRIDLFGLADVHIWNYQGSFDAWGHASMTLNDGTHISWWPNNGSDGPPVIPIYSADAFKNQTYDNDVTFEGRNPDKTIHIDGLDEQAIKKWWKDFKKNNQWKTFSQNCSTTIGDALKKGGGGKGIYLDDWNIIWTPSDVQQFAESIKTRNSKKR